MSILKNRAGMSTSTTGTGTITLGSALTGYQSFADAGVADGDIVSYLIEDGVNWEIGYGTYTASGTTLARTTVLESTNADAAINLSGSANVYITALAEDLEPCQTNALVQIVLEDDVIGASPANFDWTSISQDYDHLIVRLNAKSTAAVDLDNVFMLYNNDSTSTNYHYSRFYGYLGTMYNETGDGLHIGWVSGANLTEFSSMDFIILDYTNTSKHKFMSQVTGVPGTSRLMGVYGNVWESTAAITRITIQPDGYSTDKFAQYSRAQLIGVKKVS